jgi:hypothetical protein
VEVTADEPPDPAVAVQQFASAWLLPLPACPVAELNVSPVAVGSAIAVSADSAPATTTTRSPEFHETLAVDLEPLDVHDVSV